MKKRRIRQVRRYLIMLDEQNRPSLCGPYKTDKSREQAAPSRGSCLILDVPFHRLVHPEDRRPLVDLL